MTAHTPAERAVHVVAAVILGPRGEVLISRRHPGAHQGGLWEFPGGKLEAEEGAQAAVARELYEELGIRMTHSRPLIRIPHAYPDRTVLLDVWRVEAYRGEPHGREGQETRWVAPEDLPRFPFPAANRPIVTAARLPSLYLITPEPRGARGQFLQRFKACLAAGIRLVQLRAKQASERELEEWVEALGPVCERYGAHMLVNGDPGWARRPGVSGVHLSSAGLMACDRRPLAPEQWVAASCHSLEEIRHACRIGVDFVVASPVKATASHPSAQPLGWKGLQTLTEASSVPVYALGGLAPGDRPQAFAHGAQGIAAIRGLWDGA